MEDIVGELSGLWDSSLSADIEEDLFLGFWRGMWTGMS